MYNSLDKNAGIESTIFPNKNNFSFLYKILVKSLTGKHSIKGYVNLGLHGGRVPS